jgi:hypothetical protein
MGWVTFWPKLQKLIWSPWLGWSMSLCSVQIRKVGHAMYSNFYYFRRFEASSKNFAKTQVDSVFLQSTTTNKLAKE